MGTFGGRGKRPNRPAGAGEQGEIYIKSIVPKGEVRTEVWVLDDKPPFEGNRDDKNPGWFMIEQHYDPVAKRSWPCAIAEGNANCVGCEFPIEDPTDENDRGLAIRKTSSQYIVPVVNAEGYVSLVQMGYRAWDAFCSIFEETGTVTDAWYAVRKGDGNTYTVTRTAKTTKPEVKIGIPDDEFISEAVGKRYLEAIDRYGYDEGNFDEDPDKTGPDPDPVPQDDAAEPAAPADTDAGGWDRQMVARDASAGELKDWLDNIPADLGGPQEYPARPGRPVLVGLVEKAQAGFPPY